MNKILIALVLVVGLSGNASAKTFKSNIDGFFFKDLKCSFGDISGTYVNKAAYMENVNIRFKIFDRDDDPVGGCGTLIDAIGYNSGNKFKASNCNCSNGIFGKRKIEITVSHLTRPSKYKNE